MSAGAPAPSRLNPQMGGAVESMIPRVALRAENMRVGAATAEQQAIADGLNKGREGNWRQTLQRARERAAATRTRTVTTTDAENRIRQATHDNEGNLIIANPGDKEHARQLKEVPELARAMRKLTDPARPPLDVDEKLILESYMTGIISRYPELNNILLEAGPVGSTAYNDKLRELYEDPKFQEILKNHSQIIYSKDSDIKTNPADANAEYAAATHQIGEEDNNLKKLDTEVSDQQKRVDEYTEADAATGKPEGAKFKELKDLKAKKAGHESEIQKLTKRKRELQNQIDNEKNKRAYTRDDKIRDNLTITITNLETMYDEAESNILLHANEITRLEEIQAEKEEALNSLENKKTERDASKKKKANLEQTQKQAQQKLEQVTNAQREEQRRLLDQYEQAFADSMEEYMAHRTTESINELEQVMLALEKQATTDHNERKAQTIDKVQQEIFKKWTKNKLSRTRKVIGREYDKKNIKKSMNQFIKYGADSMITGSLVSSLSPEELDIVRNEVTNTLFKYYENSGGRLSTSDTILLANSPTHRKLIEQMSANDPSFQDRLQKLGIDPKADDVGRKAQNRFQGNPQIAMFLLMGMGSVLSSASQEVNTQQTSTA